jgi:deoxyuridine 5'-triphosphate nucleotidohydrolase
MDTTIDTNTFTAKVNVSQKAELDNVKVKYEHNEEDDALYIYGANFVDFIGIYHKQLPFEVLTKCLNNPIVFNVWKTTEDAVIPSKAHFSDTGFDLTIIKVHKRLNKKTIMYDTGIKIQLPVNYYAEIVPRSSLSKTGWMLTNSIGVIDNSYQGNLYVVVTRVEDDVDELELPFKGFQLILRKQEHGFINLMEEDDAFKGAESSRGAGGFGSSD